MFSCVTNSPWLCLKHCCGTQLPQRYLKIVIVTSYLLTQHVITMFNVTVHCNNTVLDWIIFITLLVITITILYSFTIELFISIILLMWSTLGHSFTCSLFWLTLICTLPFWNAKSYSQEVLSFLKYNGNITFVIHLGFYTF